MVATTAAAPDIPRQLQNVQVEPALRLDPRFRLAFGKFSYRRTDTERYSIAPLRLDDMNCIYESLLIILEHANQMRTLGDYSFERLEYKWALRAYASHIKEDYELRTGCAKGKILQSMELFN